MTDQKTITANVTKDNYVKMYLLLWCSGFKITEKELDILVTVVEIYVQVSKDVPKEPYLSEIVFSPKNVAKIKKTHGLTKQNWSNYKKLFLKKRVLSEKDEVVYINPLLIPRPEITFKFNINGKANG